MASQASQASQVDLDKRKFLSVIGDYDSVTGVLLAGIGHVTINPVTGEEEKNYFNVESKTKTSKIEEVFTNFTTVRKDIGIVFITQRVADRIRHLVNAYTGSIPALLEIPSKDDPYDPEKDSMLIKVREKLGL